MIVQTMVLQSGVVCGEGVVWCRVQCGYGVVWCRVHCGIV